MRAVGYELVAATAKPFARASMRIVNAYQVILSQLKVRGIARSMRLAIAADEANI